MSDKKIPAGLKARNDELKKLTFECITEALLVLMQTRKYEDISVTELCEKAGISRNTFYKTFKTKDNVFRHIVVYINRDLIFRRVGSPFGKRIGRGWYAHYFDIVRECADWFGVIIHSNLVDKYMRQVNRFLVSGAASDETVYTRLMWSGAIQNITVEWINGGFKHTSEEMAEIFCRKFNLDG